MKFSEYWLREWINPPIATNEITARLTMAGLEVDSVEPVAASFNQVIVGDIVTVTPHTEKLTICQVNVGAQDLLTVVCGANNVKSGMRVPTAVVGAQFPTMHIQKTTLRGIESQGMLCSAQELGLAESAAGIMSLPTDAPIGEDIRTYLQLDDVSITVDLTPNRGDCLSIEGLAREVSLLTETNITPVNCSPVKATITDIFPVHIHETLACPRYIGRIVKNINVNATSPLWMQERLRRSGLRSISPVVDITNYVLLELGQPMHAFDLQKLNGSIQVRMSHAGETLVLLDGQTVTLDDATLVIADEQKALAIAGVMGGLESAVSDTTQSIFFESAFFAPTQLAGCARRYGLHTDSSHRFERGVDPQLQQRAVERATQLLLDIAGGEAGQLIEVVDHNTIPTRPTVILRQARIERILGYALPTRQIEPILTRLGMQFTTLFQAQTTQIVGWQVTPPSYRFDISIEADLIEEIVRAYGYNNLPSRAPKACLQMHPQVTINTATIQSVLIQRDYQEAITYSFVDPQLQEKINPEAAGITLANPISNDMAIMRTNLWTGLLQALIYNQKRQQQRIRLFETGLRFVKINEQLQQDKMVAGIATGTRHSEQWGISSQPIDFFDIKADITALLGLSRQAFQFKPAQHHALHPGQTAAIYQGENQIGLLGALHPSLMQILEINQAVYLFELQVAPLCQATVTQFQEISKYPSTRRDIAIVVTANTHASDILTCIQATASELLAEISLFDVYQGEGIETDKKSLAIGLIFREFSRNLTESEIDTVMTKILKTLNHNFNAQLRK